MIRLVAAHPASVILCLLKRTALPGEMRRSTESAGLTGNRGRKVPSGPAPRASLRTTRLALVFTCVQTGDGWPVFLAQALGFQWSSMVHGPELPSGPGTSREGRCAAQTLPQAPSLRLTPEVTWASGRLWPRD